VLAHSHNRIPENPPPSIGKGTRVDGVRGSVRIRQRVRRGDRPLQTPSTLVPNYSNHLYVSPQRFTPGTKAYRLLPPPLGAESLEPALPVASGAPEGSGAHSDRREASPSLVGGTHSTHTHPTGGCVLCVEKEKKEKSHSKFIVPCGGWLRELCGHRNIRWAPLKCHKWKCEECAPGKRMEFLERLQGAYDLSLEKGWLLKFVTLTYAEDVDRKAVRLSLQHLVQAIRRKYGYCEYVRIPEFTKRGRIHLHLAMIMDFVPQKVLSAMWRKASGAGVVDIRAVHDIALLRNELAKYLTKGPAGKVTYSKGFPEAVPLVRPKLGVCNSCGEEHRFTFLTPDMAEKDFGLEIAGRESPGLVLRPTGGASFCGCWES